ncbi:hypothetical protein IIA15_01005 [candidate division TA06 bacterium]|nr:hypothetical protein [candidate division TA06 bacterium]
MTAETTTEQKEIVHYNQGDFGKGEQINVCGTCSEEGTPVKFVTDWEKVNCELCHYGRTAQILREIRTKSIDVYEDLIGARNSHRADVDFYNKRKGFSYSSLREIEQALLKLEEAGHWLERARNMFPGRGLFASEMRSVKK